MLRTICVNKLTTVQRETLLRGKSALSRAVLLNGTSEMDVRHDMNFQLCSARSVWLFLPVSPRVFPNLFMLTMRV